MSDMLSPAVRDVLWERRRQIEAEGWTPNHDDAHAGGEIALAGACYAIVATLTDRQRESVIHPFSIRNNSVLRDLWPWALRWWKPTIRRRDLVKAGALILAEIERLDRASSAGGRSDG